jgi:hypothetical protein
VSVCERGWGSQGESWMMLWCLRERLSDISMEFGEALDVLWAVFTTV